MTDPHRAGHESSYYPGDVNFRMADVILINKANTAPRGSLEKLHEAAGGPVLRTWHDACWAAGRVIRAAAAA